MRQADHIARYVLTTCECGDVVRFHPLKPFTQNELNTTIRTNDQLGNLSRFLMVASSLSSQIQALQRASCLSKLALAGRDRLC